MTDVSPEARWLEERSGSGRGTSLLVVSALFGGSGGAMRSYYFACPPKPKGEAYSAVGWRRTLSSAENSIGGRRLKSKKGSWAQIVRKCIINKGSINKNEFDITPVDACVRRGPAQDAPLFYTPSHFSELQSCKSIISSYFF